MAMLKAVFLDRDGVINEDVHYLHRIEDFRFVPGILDVLKAFRERGYLLIVVTNQSGIGRGYYDERQFEELTGWMLRQLKKAGIDIAKVYFSPYHPEATIERYRRDSDCRKPNPGMLLTAQTEFEIDMAASLLIGDSESDVEAGRRSGVGRTIRVSRECATGEQTSQADYIVGSVRDILSLVVNW
ncbi:MAG TPA: HAD family hydrolase, partial [Patescibacteria group bacterium]|nr:HAD family hydrolase [Patescibacteria group bacterium]